MAVSLVNGGSGGLVSIQASNQYLVDDLNKAMPKKSLDTNYTILFDRHQNK
jgi:hypothetical protein